MRKKNIIVLALCSSISLYMFAQKAGNEKMTGVVLDNHGNPVAGAVIRFEHNNSLTSTTNKDGVFLIQEQKSDNLEIISPDNSRKLVPAEDLNKPLRIVLERSDRPSFVGYEKALSNEETTASVYTTYSDELNKRSSKNIGNSLFGNVLGLTTLQGSGTYANQNPTFYIRGLQSLSGSTPLILVDGIERDITYVVPEEVESVTVLKDAAAIALYGYKGANGAINVITKRGKYNTKAVQFSLDHAINWEARRPKFVNSLTYANAVNEARNYEGQSPRYSTNELAAIESGNYPYLYPNIHWIDETFKNTSITNMANLSFYGGSQNMRYYTLLNLQYNSGFIKSPNMNDGYSTQNQFSKANFRTNLDANITPSTKMTLNVLGTLSETRLPGDNANLWDMIYSLPSLAFPVRTEDGLWGGNATWLGTMNPVAQSQAAGYTKYHGRNLFTDLTLKQDLSGFIKGLSASLKLAYDNNAIYLENHSKTYVYGSDAVTSWTDGVPSMLTRYKAGTESSLGTASSLDSWARNFNSAVALYYNNSWKKHTLYAQTKVDYEYRNIDGLDNTWYRTNLSLFAHYGYREKYYGDITLVASASNKLATKHKWAYSPTISAAWLISKEEFLKSSFVDFLKLRASFGIINVDAIPAESYWQQLYVGGSLYNFDTGYTSSLGSWQIGRLATTNPKHEKAYKYNLGIDARFCHAVSVTAEAYYQSRKDIFVASDGKYSSVLGVSAPYENAGIINSWGIEFGTDYYKDISKNVSINLGLNMTWNKSKIKEQLEEPRNHPNLVRTNHSLSQIFGMKAIGLFKDQADIDSSPTQTFGTVVPGDIKYEDVNKDGKVDADDETAIGYNIYNPEIYYSLKLGADWKGLGFNALFQGAGKYSAILNTKSNYWPLINNTNISQEYYNNRWTSQNLDAKYPRLAAESSTNNFRTSTLWLEDRSFLKLRYVEFYYKFPSAFLKKTKIVEDAKLYVRGIDLLCFDKIKITDPEMYGVSNPLTRSIVFGLSVGF